MRKPNIVDLALTTLDDLKLSFELVLFIKLFATVF